MYRLALLSDPSYADYFGTENVLAEKVTLMTRVNQVYNDDLAIRMVLVEGTEQLNLDTVEKATGPDGPCGTHSCYTLDPDSPDYVEGQLSYCDVGTLQRNQIVLGQLIGASNYDIGHIALGTNGGGIAGLGVVGSIEKAMGCTGVPDPVGDYYAIDYVAHEMGHQFAGNHTFNGTQWNCSGGNRNAGTSVEPGSGTSIMAYAGICRQDNLQPHSDPYFSQRSISEINAYTSGDAPDPVEVQDVSLTGFDAAGDTITLDYPGAAADPVTLTFGSTYTAANLEAAIEELTGEDVTIAKWGYDPYAGIYSDPAGLPCAGGRARRGRLPGDLRRRPRPVHRRQRPRGHARPRGPDVGRRQRARRRDRQGRTGEQQRRRPPHRQPRPVGQGPRQPDPAAPHAVHPARIRQGRRRRQADLPVGAERHRRQGRHRPGRQQQEERPAVPGVRPVRRRLGRGRRAEPGARREHGRHPAVADLPRHGSDPGGQHQRQDGHAARRRRPTTRTSYVVVPVPIVNCYSEFLPIKGYVGSAGSKTPRMHFRLTARDTVPGGGGVGHDDVTLRIDQKAGPFLVSSFAKGGSVKAGSKKTIVWKVNGTRKLAANVQIVLSTDNGKTWKKVLARKTANDGRARVRLPKGKAAQAWVMVRAVDNYFFDVSDSAFRIR